MIALTIFGGALVGLFLGLTGAGGALLAVPFLVYGLSVEPAQAVLVSLVAVAITSLLGAANRARLGQIDYRAAVIFALGGVAGAPVGTWIGGHMPHALLLGLFAVLTFGIALQMWRKAGRAGDAEITLSAATPVANALLVSAGAVTGVLSGIFGVGGGFLIVPALIAVRRMNFRRAVGTSLLTVSIISLAAAISAIAGGRALPGDLTALFVVGALGGLVAGVHLNRVVAAPKLQRAFAAGMIGLAAFTLCQTLIG